MHHFFLPAPLSEEALAAPLTFSRKDWQHLFVLRLREGEEFVLADGCGREHICRVTDVQKNSLTASVIESRDSARELDCQLILLKAVELGASSIVPVMMARSNVRLDDKKADRKAERLNEIAKSAAEQSKRGILPEVASPKRFADAIALAKDADIKLICYEDETAAGRLQALLPQLNSAKKIALLVGPEGGISEEEWQAATCAGFQSVSLGRRILRTETAGLCLLSFLMLHLENA